MEIEPENEKFLVRTALINYNQYNRVQTAKITTLTPKEDPIIQGLNGLSMMKDGDNDIKILEIFPDYEPSLTTLRFIAEKYPNVKVRLSLGKEAEQHDSPDSNSKPWWKFW